MDLARKLKLIDDSIKKKANNDLEEMDLTIAQHHTLVFLVRRENHTAELKEIEREFRVSQPTVAGIAQRLEAKGYVESMQHPTDKRVKMIRLTPQGEALCKRSWEKMKARGERMTAGLSEEELAELDRLLDIVYRNIEAAD
ncbi:MAG: MarR family transcriptional regulator [Oscillospiraceae bacterium]|nr:MarR family transcriptional regulator [Oscillospiraceae bacterium]